jgi:hypothetical protein
VRVLDQDVEALAIRAEVDRPTISVQVDAALPNGDRVPLLRAQARQNWERRYWFDRPVALPRGSRIEVVGLEGDIGDDLLGIPAPPAAAAATSATPSLRVTLDFIARR